VVKPLRETGIADFAARAVVVMLFALLSINLLQEFLRTHHVTGLLLLAQRITRCRAHDRATACGGG
jgi:hypothetical protein